MPPHRKPRRFLTTASFYDKSGAIADGSPQPSPTASTFFWDAYGQAGAGPMDVVVDRGAESDDDDEYTLTGYGEMSTEDGFMLPPSPTQTIKYRYRAYRPKLARLRKIRSSASKGPLKVKAAGHHSSVRVCPSHLRLWLALCVGRGANGFLVRQQEYIAILNAYLSGTPGKSAKRDFQALIQKYRDSADSGSRDADPYAIPRKGYADRAASSTSVRRTGSGLAYAAR
ncbi:hypothetical protein PYCCODRAFT_1523042 [Trametes coccinea BRFM310]|uniref:Uncharacterized protein n=1 Tax=Trametes coccinea (strain BRFM310) TaxID=1353009 RepID=A0A1Y2ID70_TRAC3|nr:hypothetical protein PYCCODRAFT_1523042 [Trametes coccinea BRFM310]